MMRTKHEGHRKRKKWRKWLERLLRLAGLIDPKQGLADFQDSLVEETPDRFFI
jgi:hypothetical protein